MHQAVLLKTDFMKLLKLAFFLALLFRLAIVKAIAFFKLVRIYNLLSKTPHSGSPLSTSQNLYLRKLI